MFIIFLASNKENVGALFITRGRESGRRVIHGNRQVDLSHFAAAFAGWVALPQLEALTPSQGRVAWRSVKLRVRGLGPATLPVYDDRKEAVGLTCDFAQLWAKYRLQRPSF